ncbi:MAG TPA: fibronectin type III domain-containing protein, partial [Candidatus Thermoplasmatota archaeon]|nr:fibronectin type III domain-containing protein [Candidatus Thermoplasmatota archaeon]
PEGEAHYAVAALTSEAEGPRSAWALATDGATPAAPGNLTATPGDGAVSLRWSAPAEDGGLGVDAYVVLRGTGPDDLAPVAETREASFEDAPLANGVAYRYEVAARNALGEGPRAAAVTARPTALPPAPAGLLGLAGDRRATIAWNASPGEEEAPILGYRVYRSDGEGEPVLVALVADATLHRDEGLSNIVEYAYSVSAVSRVGEGPRSAPVVVAPSPVDAEAPLLRSFAPPDGLVGVDDRQEIAISYLDGAARVTAVLTLDGVEVARAEMGETRLAYKPPRNLDPGPHAVVARLRDPGGRETTLAWGFRLLDNEQRQPRLVWENLTMDGAELALGDNITLRATARNAGLVPLRIESYWTEDGRAVEVFPVALAPGESRDFSLNYTPRSAGTFALSVGGLAPLSLPVIALDPEPPAPAEDGEAEPTAEGEGGAAEGGGLGIPAPGAAWAVPGLALLAWARRRR